MFINIIPDSEYAMKLQVLVFLGLEQVTWLNTLPFIATIQSRDLF